VPTTFTAFIVALIALLPGASYNFAYERAFGYTPTDRSSDRLVRFLAASAVFQAVYSGPELVLYRHYIVTGRLRAGRLHWWLAEIVALAYVLIPSLIGVLIGRAQGPQPSC
jgi:hypothetical protein